MCAVKAPGFGDNRKAVLRDMAISTGAVVSGIYRQNRPFLVLKMRPGGRCSNGRIGPTVGSFFNYVNLIDCSFSTTSENDVILGQSYVTPILPL